MPHLEMRKPREEEDWTSLYPNCQLENITSVSASHVQVKNDWQSRLEPIKEQLQTAKQLGMLGMMPLGKRGRGRPRKKPMTSSLASLSQRSDASMVQRIREACGRRRRPNHLMKRMGEYDDPSMAEWDDEEGGVVPRYDLDEIDLCWLRAFNQQRIMPVTLTAEWLEMAIDGLERHWWSLSHRLATWISHQQPQHHTGSLCAVCWQCESGSPNNLMVMCEGCDVAVHQDCYGILHIPEGPWLCRRCLVSGGSSSSLSQCNSVACSLCPWPGGALKQTNDPKHPWAHLACVHYLPGEAQLLNPVYREPIDLFAIDPGRWKLTCQLCRRRHGAPVQCAERSCHVAMHVQCARKAGCTLTWIPAKIYCPRHATTEVHDDDAIVEVVARRSSPPKVGVFPTVSIEDEGSAGRASSKPAFLSAPVAPAILLDRLLTEELPSLGNAGDRYRLPLLQTIARYWAVRRRVRRGMPLLRSISTNTHERGIPIAGEMRTRRYLLADLRRLRGLTAWCARRERLRVAALRTKLELFDCISKPFQTMLTIITRTLMREADPDAYFKEPVHVSLAPDYYEIVKEPMCMDTILERIPQYRTMAEYEADVSRIWSNAYLYNAPETVYHQAALQLEARAKELIKSAKLQSITVQTSFIDELVHIKEVQTEPSGKKSSDRKVAVKEVKVNKRTAPSPKKNRTSPRNR